MAEIRIRLTLPPGGEAGEWRLAGEIARRAGRELGAPLSFSIPRRPAPGGRIRVEFLVPPGVDPGRARRVLQRLATLAVQGRLLPPEEPERAAGEEEAPEPLAPQRGAGSERRAEGAGGEKGSPSEEADRPRGVSPDDQARSGRGEKNTASPDVPPEAEEVPREEDREGGGVPTGGDGGGGGGGSGPGGSAGGEAEGAEGRAGPGGSGEDGEGWLDMAPSLEGGSGEVGAVGVAPALGAPPARILTGRDWSVPERAGEIREILARILGPSRDPRGWAEDQPGGRWDPRRVALRVAGWLRPLRPEDRREEAGQVRLLVAPDVSASMGPAGRAGLALAATAAKIMGCPVVVVAHTNGAPDEIWVPPDPPVVAGVDWRDPRAILSFWERLVREERVAAAVVVADAQGEEAFRLLARMGVRLFWLDPHGSRALGLRFPRKFPPPHMRRGAFPVDPLPPGAIREWQALGSRVRYAAGCGDLETILAALRRLIG